MLTTLGHQVLLIACPVNDMASYDIFVAKGGAEEVGDRPSFQLQGNQEKNSYALRRCDVYDARGARRAESRKLGQFDIYAEKCVGNKFKIFCMDVDLQRAPVEGSCPSPKASQDPEDDCDMLTSVRPFWHDKRKTLLLNFGGRAEKSCARNFQLSYSGEHKDSKLMFALKRDGSFVLHYKKPFGAVQAFAAALCSERWQDDVRY